LNNSFARLPGEPFFELMRDLTSETERIKTKKDHFFLAFGQKMLEYLQLIKNSLILLSKKEQVKK
jgi:hypothetical protein